ncbi:MAG: hypothetical protein ABFD52_09070 [Acidobacteriota bacterium]
MGDAELSDLIRAIACREFIEPARARSRKEVTIRAGDLHEKMRLVGRMPAVCGALGTLKFQRENGIKLISREGPSNGPNAIFKFLIEYASDDDIMS